MATSNTTGKSRGKARGTELRPMLTVREASEILNVHSNTLRRWCKHGLVRAYRMGPRGERRFRREDIYALFSEEKPGYRGSGGRRRLSRT